MLRHNRGEQSGRVDRVDQIVIEAPCAFHFQRALADLGYKSFGGLVEAFRADAFAGFAAGDLNSHVESFSRAVLSGAHNAAGFTDLSSILTGPFIEVVDGIKLLPGHAAAAKMGPRGCRF